MNETENKTRFLTADSKYFTHLDGLRTIAIFLVMMEHFGGPIPKYIAAGYYGVDLFFVISGFLITTILLKARGGFGSAYKTFMGRRTLRIFPVYYAALLVFFACNFANTREDIMWLLTYTWNYRAAIKEGKLFYLWSLCVEEQFYLFWPFLILTLRNRRRTLLVITSTMVCVSYGHLLFNFFPAISMYNYTGLINRMGSLGLGAVGAIGFVDGWIPRKPLRSVVVEALTFICLIWALMDKSTAVRLPVMGICSMILVFKGVNGDFVLPGLEKGFSHPAATFTGRISYGFYVYHWPLGLALNTYVFDPIWLRIDFAVLGPLAKLRWHSWIIKLPLYSLATIGVAYLSYKFFEMPLLKLKDRWFPNSPHSKQSQKSSSEPASEGGEG